MITTVVIIMDVTVTITMMSGTHVGGQIMVNAYGSAELMEIGSLLHLLSVSVTVCNVKIVSGIAVTAATAANRRVLFCLTSMTSLTRMKPTSLRASSTTKRKSQWIQAF